MLPEMAASLASCRAKSCVSVSLTFLLRLLPSLWLMTTWGKGEQGNAGGLGNWESLLLGHTNPTGCVVHSEFCFHFHPDSPPAPPHQHSFLQDLTSSFPSFHVQASALNTWQSISADVLPRPQPLQKQGRRRLSCGRSPENVTSP